MFNEAFGPLYCKYFYFLNFSSKLKYICNKGLYILSAFDLPQILWHWPFKTSSQARTYLNREPSQETKMEASKEEREAEEDERMWKKKNPNPQDSITHTTYGFAGFIGKT